MQELQKKIIRYFLLFTFILVIILGNLDWLMELLIHTPQGQNYHTAVLIGNILIQALVYMLCAYLFMKKVTKLFAREQAARQEEAALLFANLAHDLKTPLTSVIGFSQALADGVVPEEKKTACYQTIQRKSHQANEMLDQLLQLAKDQSEVQPSSLVEIDVTHVLRELLMDQQNQFTTKGISVETDIPDEPCLIQVNPLDLQRVLENLLENAYKYNGAGSRVGVKLDTKKRQIFIADTGERISQEEFTLLCQPFVRKDLSRQTAGGTGLGLAICQSICRKYGWEFGVTDKVPRAYTKAFTLGF